jgi:hypothetical protein
MSTPAADPAPVPPDNEDLGMKVSDKERRTGNYDLPDVTCVDIVALEESVVKVDWETLAHILPLILR